MAEIISSDVQRDVEDIGKAVNTSAIITPRYGAPFKSIPLIAAEFEFDIVDLRTNKADLSYVDAQLNNKANTVDVYGKSETYSKVEVDSVIGVVGVGNKAYKTYAEMDADKANITANSKVTVTNDPTSSNNGDWQWNGTVFTKSIYDPLNQSKSYTDLLVKNIKDNLPILKSSDANIIPLLEDAAGKALAYYDKKLDKFVGAGLVDSVFDEVPQIKKTTDSRYISGYTDANGRILWGWDKLLDKFFGADSSNALTKNYTYFQTKPVAVDVNHMLGYGESLSVGATATTIISTSQPYFNTTFNSGPRQDTAATSIIPLVEQFNNPAADGGTNRGETFCSGAANYASVYMLEDGINPQDHVIFASTSGLGGATIGNLTKGGAAYTRLLNHISTAKSLNSGSSYKVLFTPFIIGSNDAAAATTYSSFKTTLTTVCEDINADVKLQTSQTEDVVFALTQVSYGAATQPQMAKALLDMVNENENFVLATPLYHFPYSDGVHLTNVGYKWMGAYIGRAYSQYVNEGRKADFINPKNAYISGSKIYIKFDVPTLPLQIDTSNLAPTTNHGFKVLNGATDVPITSISVSSDTVILQLSSTPTTNLQVRYALDYLGSGLSITNGASGNLRDSTQDSVIISGSTKPLYHVCPHFELTAFLDKGI